jgi:[acyl-carrier-protein] S-malonyltransferase
MAGSTNIIPPFLIPHSDCSMTQYVLLFAGQGAQEVGMGREVAAASEPAAEVFDLASDAIDVDMREVCFEGPAERLNRTDMCQPAILTVSVALLRALEEKLEASLSPLAVAGLSLGEYSALVAADALEFVDAVRLTHARGSFMQEACDANPGTMYSVIGLEDEQVEEACRQVRDEGGRVWPANYNCPGQLVISGEKEAAGRAAERCEEAGARRAIQLKVAGAFHSPLMQPAADQLQETLQNVTFRSPDYPVLANVTGKPVEDPEEIRELLARQVTSPVRWAASMNWCVEKGAESFIELGPGRVLRGLLRRIDRSLDCTSINELEKIRSFER